MQCQDSAVALHQALLQQMGQVVPKLIGQSAVRLPTAPTKASIICKGTGEVAIMIGQLLWLY